MRYDALFFVGGGVEACERLVFVSSCVQLTQWLRDVFQLSTKVGPNACWASLPTGGGAFPK